MHEVSAPPRIPDSLMPPHTRIAVPGDGPGYRVIDVVEGSFPEYCDRLISLLADTLRGRGREVPSVALREVVDNLIHAVPCSASVVLDPSCKNVCVSDTGPGITRPDLAFELGYSTADSLQRSYIRGVGLGLHLARRDLQSRGGDLQIEAVPGEGTFVRMSVSGPPAAVSWEEGAIRLSQRQNNILFLLSEGESFGPSGVASELNIGVSTAYRELIKLQDLGLFYMIENGKRFLSESGRSYLQGLLSL